MTVPEPDQPYAAPDQPYAAPYPPTHEQPAYPGYGAPADPAFGPTQDPSYGQQPYPQPPYAQSGYPPPGYGQPGYGQVGYPPAFGAGQIAPRNGIGTAALVLGILAVVFCWTFWGGVVMGILAIIFGGVGLGRANRGEASNRGSALAGLVLGIVALALLVLLAIVGIAAYSTTFG